MKSLVLLTLAFAALASAALPVWSAELPVLVVSGMQSESSVAAGSGVVTVLSAGNVQQLRSALQAYSAANVRAVISFGVTGGLDTNLQPGQLVVPDTIVSESEANSWPVTPELVTFLRSQFATAGLAPAFDSVAGEDTTTAIDPASRAALAQATGAGIVDNESQIVAEFATANGLPFAVIRAVSDPASFTLPPAALIPLNSNGTPNESAIAESVAKDPSQLSALMQLDDDNNAAIATLKKCVSALPLGNLPDEQTVSSRSLPF